MTKENCVKLLKAYKAMAENPKGADSKAKADVKFQSGKNYEMMKAHILKSKKFKGHPIILELSGHVEEKKSGKKSKR